MRSKIVLALTCFLAGPALGHPATLVPVTAFPGSTTTGIFAINDNGEIVGEYANVDGIEHGFYGPPNGTYTSFDYGGTALGTEIRGLNNAGDMVGFGPDAGFNNGPEFFLSHDGALTTYKIGGVALDGINQGINKRGSTVGDYISDPATNTQTGYQGRKGHYRFDLDLGIGTKRVDPRAITSLGVIAGWYVGLDSVQHGFILKDGSVLQTIDADDSGTTDIEGLNDKGIATGAVLDVDSNFHSFVLDTNTNTYTWIDVPGATNVQAWGINKSGLVAVSTDIGSFIYCPLKPANCPAGGTLVEMRESKLMPVTHPMKLHAARTAPKGAAR